MDSGGYFGMPIPAIKCDNLNGYGRILIADHESRGKIRAINYITNNLLIDQDFSQRLLHKDQPPRKRRERLRKLSCDTLLSSPLIFSILGFHVRISVYVCLLIGSLHSVLF